MRGKKKVLIMIKSINQYTENIATGIVKPKTTAFFDKLWIPDGYENCDINCNLICD